MRYALKQFVVSVIEAEEDGVLLNLYGEIPFLKGDKIASRLDGEQFVIPKGQFEELWIPVREVVKREVNKNVMAKGYIEGIPGNEEDIEYIDGTINMIGKL
jgi:hypothetical protein